MEPERGINDDSVVDRLVAHAVATVPDRTEFESCLRHYYAHVDLADLEGRRVADLFRLAADHLQLGTTWTPGSILIEVTGPRVEGNGWDSDHTVVRIVTDDMPFLVDSVTMELSRLGIGIHLVVYPVMYRRESDLSFVGADDATEEHGPVTFISLEIDRQGSQAERESIEQDLRRVLGDVSAAVRDWEPMQARMREVSASLATDDVPIDDAEVAETRELLDWLAGHHFIFLGARDYELTKADGVEVVRLLPGTGLGILSGNEHLAAPRPVDDLLPAARDRVHEKRLLNLTKTSSLATVHRASYMDYVGIKTFNAAGEAIGERRFLGLFTAEVYTHSVATIPRARRIAAGVLERTGYPSGGHDEKRLLAVLELYPRDDLLQMDVEELFDTAIAITGLQERRRVRVFARTELFGRFVTVLVYLPRDRYNTTIRAGIEEILLDAYGGSLADWDAQMSESVLARLRFVLRVDGSSRSRAVDTEDRIEELIQVWVDDFVEALADRFGAEEALRLGHIYREAFGPDYQRAFDPTTASSDVEQIEGLGSYGDLCLSAYREPGHLKSAFKLKLYRRGERVSLTAVMPSLTNLGVTVVDERPYEIVPEGQDPVWIYDFALEHEGTDLDFSMTSSLIEEAFAAVWSHQVEDDGFNRLVLGVGLAVADVAVLRAYGRYLRQVGLAYTRVFVERTLEEHPTVARLLFELFAARFDPDGDGDVADIEIRIAETIESIESLDQDRLLRRFHNLITATVRTTWGQREADGSRRPYLAFKLDPTAIDELPKPTPRHEIFVYSPRFEGVHLRGGPVARGGLRWSDRTEDYRTEVLGLLKAQMVKNAVIAPGGAKGGFVLKRRPADSAALRDEVVACYRLFVSALLDLTDNLVDGEFVPPAHTVRHDDGDAYLVVAADKGTATFSDVANEIAQSRGFWLGDAFASGGSHGYDHKEMGITARGAWESVKGHFREIGRDIQTEPFTAVGIGDMSGDVFGNGMLLSRFTRLVAAFDHRHIFIDPDPDPETSYVERRRLFDTPRSSWADYDTSLLSAGGGVHERTAKSIELSAEARAALWLGTDIETLTPDELMSAVLKAPVDLFWNGGIGTYVKAHDESHAEVGDKATDRVRIDGRDLRCAVVGEGGNLGVTQRGRIEFARGGGRIYTDAIDNVGGVDCSDHEVNIKILLDGVVRDGDMTTEQRNELLEEMTEEVSSLVLANNYSQSIALSEARIDAVSLVDVHARYIAELEHLDLLDRHLEALPDADELTERRLAGTGLTTPEIAVLKAYTKNILKPPLLESHVPDDAAMTVLLIDYFPAPLRKRFADRILKHQLRREIIANRLANLVVDRAGVSMIYRLGQETSAPATEIAAAHYAAWKIFDLESVVNEVNALDDVLSIDEQLAIHLGCRRLSERATRLLIRTRPNPFSAADAIAELGASVAEAASHICDELLGSDRDLFDAQVVELTEAGAPVNLARRAAGLSPSLEALNIVGVASELGAEARDIAAIHFAVAQRLDLTWLRDRILALPRDTRWSTLARLTLRTDLYADHRQLTSQMASVDAGEVDAMAQVEKWIERHRIAVEVYHQTMVEIRSTSSDVTVLLVAAREVRNLISRTTDG